MKTRNQLLFFLLAASACANTITLKTTGTATFNGTSESVNVLNSLQFYVPAPTTVSLDWTLTGSYGTNFGNDPLCGTFFHCQHIIKDLGIVTNGIGQEVINQVGPEGVTTYLTGLYSSTSVDPELHASALLSAGIYTLTASMFEGIAPAVNLPYSPTFTVEVTGANIAAVPEPRFTFLITGLLFLACLKGFLVAYRG